MPAHNPELPLPEVSLKSRYTKEAKEPAIFCYYPLRLGSLSTHKWCGRTGVIHKVWDQNHYPWIHIYKVG